MRLILETDDGPIILLNENLGTLSQKHDLAQAIEHAITRSGDK